jgi:hypothetical protein
MSPYIKRHWDTFNAHRETPDIAFVFLRIIILWGVVGWLLFSPVSRETVGYVSSLVILFVIYSIFIYLFLFFLPEKKRTIYPSLQHSSLRQQEGSKAPFQTDFI